MAPTAVGNALAEGGGPSRKLAAVLALLHCLSRPLPAAARCSPQGVPCGWPLTLKTGEQVSTCQTSDDRGTWCSASGDQRYWASCVPCISGCNKNASSTTSNPCTMDMASSTPVTLMGTKVVIPSRYALVEYAKCLLANCADMSSNIEPFASMIKAAQLFGTSIELSCPTAIGGWKSGANGPLTCSSSPRDVRLVGSFINEKLVEGITFGHFCRHTCHCGSCCGGTGPACTALPTVSRPTPAPTPAPAPTPTPIEVGAGSKALAPGALLALLLLLGMQVARR